jgi:hypothetical protein
VFAIVEEIIPVIVNEGLHGDEFFMRFVDERNLAEGDRNEFVSYDNQEFVTAWAADGTQGIRRQRIESGEKVSIATKLFAVKIYEELNRILSKRITFADFVTKVGEAMMRRLWEEVFTLFNGITAATPNMAPGNYATGVFDVDTLLGMIDRVEVDAGQKATILGARNALRKIDPNFISDEGNADLYNVGYFGKFYGTSCLAFNNRFRAGSKTDYVLDQNRLYVIASDDKFIKVVNEGEALLVATDPLENADLTQEYLLAQKFGAALMLSRQIGIYNLT